ncbi:uncharacterized protein LOC132295922 [Cornus florida]|uniref:uncharacterized protein LOC132295922 n=1 Tax=Cornus florida TaxID=4283 RepID=UPI0028A257B9|nr:uncharacterized protein LOC132295922 [Cornus florida]
MLGSYFPGTRIIYPDALVKAHNALSRRMEQLEGTQREVVTLLREIVDRGVPRRDLGPTSVPSDELTGGHMTPENLKRHSLSSSAEVRRAAGQCRQSRDAPPRARRTLFSTPLTAPARRRLPNHHMRNPLHSSFIPRGYLTPKFNKFDGRKGNPREHVVLFIEALGPFGNDHTLRLREFSKTLTDRAYKWYANLESGSLTTWNQLATIFQSKFFQAEERVTTLSLTKAMEYYETHEEEALAKICIQGMQGSYRIHFINLKLPTFADLIEGATQEEYRGRRRPQVAAVDEPNSKRNGRPARAPRTKNPDKAPPPFPCTPEEVETILKKWIQHGDIRLPEVLHEPTAEEMAHPKYCMDVREEPFPAHDRGAAMMVSGVANDEGRVEEDVSSSSNDYHQHGDSVAQVALVREDDLDAFRLLETAPVKNILQKMDFSPLAQKEIAKILWLAAKEGVKEVASITSLPVPQRLTGSAIVFTEEDKCVLTPHNRPLYVTASLNGVELKRAFLDNGSSLNIMPLEIFRRTGLPSEKLIRKSTEITGFGSDIRRTEGYVTTELVIGKFKGPVKFHVIDSDTPYHLLMGRGWMHKFGIVPSSYHQCIKVFWNGKQVTVRCSDRPFTNRESYMVEAAFFNELEEAEEPQPLKAYSLPKWEAIDR